jgi:hypothetical protein
LIKVLCANRKKLRFAPKSLLWVRLQPKRINLFRGMKKEKALKKLEAAQNLIFQLSMLDIPFH